MVVGDDEEGDEGEGVEGGEGEGAEGGVELARGENKCDVFLRVALSLSQVLLPPSSNSSPLPSPIPSPTLSSPTSPLLLLRTGDADSSCSLNFLSPGDMGSVPLRLRSREGDRPLSSIWRRWN